MAERRHLLAPLVLSLLLSAAAPAAQAQDAPQVRVQDLPGHLQTAVTVQGRTGYIVQKYEKRGLHVFTLRDDYNGQVFVRMASSAYPIMGTTYRVTGWANRADGTVFLDTFPGQVVSVYPLPTAPAFTAPAAPVPSAAPSLPSQVLLWAPSVVPLLFAVTLLVLALRRWLGRPRRDWGELLVTSGPDRGMAVPMRRRRVVLGRGVSAARDVRLSGGDPTISNEHAVLTHRRGELYITDHSSNGTRVGGEKLTAGVPQQINSGDLIHLGTRGTVVIVRLRAAAPAAGGLLSLLRAPSPAADKTIMVPETAAEPEPAWMRPPVEAPAPPAEAPPAEAPQGDAPATQAVATQAVAVREVEADEDTEEEDSVPHTHLSPMVFSFAGHSPRASRLLLDDGMARDRARDADEEAAPH